MNKYVLFICIYQSYVLSLVHNQTVILETMTTFKIETFNKGTLFAVVCDSDIWSPYYKTRKTAERKLAQVRKQAGRN